MANIQYIKICKIIVINLLIILFLLALLELVAKSLVEPHEVKMYSDRTDVIRGRPFVVKDNEIGFLLVPNYQSTDIHINSGGFRGEEIKDSLKDDYVILAIGGSTTFGWGLEDQYTYPYQLQQQLSNNNIIREIREQITVINAGIPSFTSTQQKLYLDRIIPDINPDLVIVMTGINDYHYSLLKNWYPEILLLRMPSAWRLWLTNNSSIFKLLLTRNQKPGKLVNVFNEDALNHFRSNIQEMIEISDSHNVDIIAIAPPINGRGYIGGEFSPFNEIVHTGEYIIQSQKRFWDSQVEIFTQANKTTIEHSMSVSRNADSRYFHDYCHLTPEGNKIFVNDIIGDVVEIIRRHHQTPLVTGSN